MSPDAGTSRQARRPTMSSPDAVIATSINPRDRLDHQLRCFRRWRDFGLEVLSFNVATERDALLAAGLPTAALVEIDASASMLPETGRANPRVLPILERLRALARPWNLLVNADIFPATARNPLPLMTSVGPAVCWARRDCLNVDDPPQAPGETYHGGLDAFQFGQEALAELVVAATAYSESRSMAFGVPGWDLFVAHLAASQGSVIAAADFLRHPRHAPGYQTLDSFVPLARRMMASGRYAAADHLALAEEFAQRIQRACAGTVRTSHLLSRALAPAPSPMPRPTAVTTARDAWSALHLYLPDSDLEQLWAAQLARPDWGTLRLAFRRFEGSASAMLAYLLALEAAVHLRHRAGRGWLTRYPADARHGEQRRHVLVEVDPVKRHDGLLDLLGRDLFEHGILNLPLLKYVVALCRHEAEQRRFATLLATLKETRAHELARAA